MYCSFVLGCVHRNRGRIDKIQLIFSLLSVKGVKYYAAVNVRGSLSYLKKGRIIVLNLYMWKF